jgi:superfamily II DNA helicase RecQ
MEVKQAIDRVAKMYDYTELKMEQLDILHHFITGNDVFGCLPTGGLLCTLPMLFDAVFDKYPGSSIVIVICPLTSLMED